MEYRYTNDPVMTLILATYLKVTSLTGFIVNTTAVQVANLVSTRLFCFGYSYEKTKLRFLFVLHETTPWRESEA